MKQGNAVVPVTVVAAADSSSAYPKQVYVTPAPAPTAAAPVAPEKEEKSRASSLSSKSSKDEPGWAGADSKEGEVHRL